MVYKGPTAPEDASVAETVTSPVSQQPGSDRANNQGAQAEDTPPEPDSAPAAQPPKEEKTETKRLFGLAHQKPPPCTFHVYPIFISSTADTKV
jgi:hypothetical protein